MQQAGSGGQQDRGPATLDPILVRTIGDRRSGLLFDTERGRPLLNLHGSLERVFTHAGVRKPAGKAWHLFRHTYTAMRLQTMDNGQPVSPWTVMKELGHGSLALIEQT